MVYNYDMSKGKKKDFNIHVYPKKKKKNKLVQKKNTNFEF